MRSKQVNLDFYKKFCADSFGEDLWPDTERKNNEYGGLNIKAFNLLMSNGDEGTCLLSQILGNGLVWINHGEVSFLELPIATIAPIA